MPALGMIRLDLAHRDEEVLIKLACASPDTAAFIQKRLPALETAIRALGYRKASLASRTQIPGEGSPDWHKALNRAAVIA